MYVLKITVSLNDFKSDFYFRITNELINTWTFFSYYIHHFLFPRQMSLKWGLKCPQHRLYQWSCPGWRGPTEALLPPAPGAQPCTDSTDVKPPRSPAGESGVVSESDSGYRSVGRHIWTDSDIRLYERAVIRFAPVMHRKYSNENIDRISDV